MRQACAAAPETLSCAVGSCGRAVRLRDAWTRARGRPGGRRRTTGRVPAWRLASASRASRTRSWIRDPLAVTGERAGGGRTAPAPETDNIAGDPAGRRRPPRPARTARTAASARRPTGCCARSAGRPSPRCSGPGGRSRSPPTGLCATGRSAACRARSGRSPRRTSPIFRPGRVSERWCGSAGRSRRQNAAAAPPRWSPGSPTSAGRRRRCGNDRCRRCRSPIP